MISLLKLETPCVKSADLSPPFRRSNRKWFAAVASGGIDPVISFDRDPIEGFVWGEIDLNRYWRGWETLLSVETECIRTRISQQPQQKVSGRVEPQSDVLISTSLFP